MHNWSGMLYHRKEPSTYHAQHFPCFCKSNFHVHCVPVRGDSRERVWMKKKLCSTNGKWRGESRQKLFFLLHLKMREISDVLCSALQALLLPKVAASMQIQGVLWQNQVWHVEKPITKEIKSAMLHQDISALLNDTVQNFLLYSFI